MRHYDEATNIVIEIPDDVWDELNDERFAKRQHYSRATYALGCHGPLCRLAETHRGRRRNKERAQAKGGEYREGARQTGREAELMPVITWHLQTRGVA